MYRGVIREFRILQSSGERWHELEACPGQDLHGTRNAAAKGETQTADFQLSRVHKMFCYGQRQDFDVLIG